MKFGIQAKIFGDLSLAENLERIKEAGYNGVEWNWGVVDAPEGLIMKEDIPKIKSAAKKIEKLSREFILEPISLTPGILPNFAEEPDILKIHFEGIKESRAKFLRMFGPVYVGILKPTNKYQAYYDGKKDFHTLAKDFQKHLEVLVKLAEEFKLKVLFETHDGYLPTSFSGFYLFLKDHNPDHIGILLDPENMVREGMENWRMGMEMLYPHIGYLHCKNMGWERGDGKSPPQHMKNWKAVHLSLSDGIVDWPQIIYFLKKMGFSNYLVDEDYSKNIPEERFQNIAYLKNLISQTEDPWEKWFNWSNQGEKK